MELGPSSGDRIGPTLIGPIIGPAITAADGQPTVPVNETPFLRTSTAGPRRLTDLPDAETFLAPGMEGLYSSLAADPPGEPRSDLEPYVAYNSPDTPPDPEIFNIAQIVVKLVEGSCVRLDGRKLIVTPDVKEPANVDRLRRAGVKHQTVRRQVAEFNSLVTASGAAVGRAAPHVDPELLAMLHRRAENESGAEMPNPNLFYFVHSKRTKPKAAAKLLAALRRLPIVEAAYFQPIPFDATDIPPTTTIDVTPQQGYFRPSPLGIDVDFARRFAGGRVEGIRIVDIEAGGYLHEDLPRFSFAYGYNFGQFFSGEHGTAVLGQIAAQENSFGATGIVPSSEIGWSSVTSIDVFMPWQTYFYSVANALLSAGYFLRKGDIALIEQHFPRSTAGPCPNNCNCSQFGYVAVETFADEHAAIRLMTSAGVVVVEAAGNGQTMVTPASPTDSGAIVVGASNNDLTPACFTNFGPRVDVHAWGGNIGTLGYATMSVTRLDAAGNVVLDAAGNPIVDEVPDPTLRANGADVRQFYTRTFSGTSGASPIVVGAAALVQSTRAARGLNKLTSVQMRSLLVATGTPQATTTVATVIGPLPNLAAAIATYIPDQAAFIRQTGAPSAISIGSIFNQGITFRNSGSRPWVGYSMAIASGGDGSYPWGTAFFTLGSAAAPVMPGAEVTCVFTLHAPALPGTYTLDYHLASAAGAKLAHSPRQFIAVTGSAAFDNATATIDLAPGTIKVGVAALVIVTARNTGSTTWSSPRYLLRLSRSGRIALPQPTAPLSVSVAPGQSLPFIFTILGASTPGLGGFHVQMVGPNGAFGQSIGKSVVCQP
jgi:subtilisin family serine protease